jgi:YbbR domain-containing protein
MITFLRNLLFHDFWLKLFSFALAILIWLTVWFARSKDLSPFSAFTSHAAEQNYFNVPVLVILPAADVRSVKVDPSAVQVTVEGDPKRLQDLRVKDIHAQVDLTGIESARGLRKRIDVTTPAGITYVRVVPDEVEVIIPPRE